MHVIFRAGVGGWGRDLTLCNTMRSVLLHNAAPHCIAPSTAPQKGSRLMHRHCGTVVGSKSVYKTETTTPVHHCSLSYTCLALCRAPNTAPHTHCHTAANGLDINGINTYIARHTLIQSQPSCLRSASTSFATSETTSYFTLLPTKQTYVCATASLSNLHNCSPCHYAKHPNSVVVRTCYPCRSAASYSRTILVFDAAMNEWQGQQASASPAP